MAALCALLLTLVCAFAIPDFLVNRNYTFTNHSAFPNTGIMNASFVCQDNGVCLSNVSSGGDGTLQGGRSVDSFIVVVNGTVLNISLNTTALNNSYDARYLVNGTNANFKQLLASTTNLTTAQITELTNLYYTDERVDDRVGVLITNTTTVLFSYGDVAGTLSATVPANSITLACQNITGTTSNICTLVNTDSGGISNLTLAQIIANIGNWSADKVSYTLLSQFNANNNLSLAQVINGLALKNNTNTVWLTQNVSNVSIGAKPVVWIDTSLNRTGFGTAAPGSAVDIVGTLNATTLQQGGKSVCLGDGTNCPVIINVTNTDSGGTSNLTIASVLLSIPLKNNTNTVWLVNNVTNISLGAKPVVWVDTSLNRTGFGTAAPGATVDIIGTLNATTLQQTGKSVCLGDGTNCPVIVNVTNTDSGGTSNLTHALVVQAEGNWSLDKAGLPNITLGQVATNLGNWSTDKSSYALLSQLNGGVGQNLTHALIVTAEGNWSADKSSYTLLSQFNANNNLSLSQIVTNIGNWSADKSSYTLLSQFNSNNNFSLANISANLGNLSAVANVVCYSNGTGCPASSSSVPITAMSPVLNVSKTIDMVDEFFGKNAAEDGEVGDWGWSQGTQGTGATVSYPAMPTADALGLVQIDSGTDPLGNSSLFLDTDQTFFNATAGNVTTVVRVRFPTLSDGTDTYVARFGYCDAAIGAFNCTDGFFFEYNQSSNGNFWLAGATNNSAATYVNTTSAVAATTWYTLTTVFNGSQINYYVNGVYAVNITTNYPTGSSRVTSPFMKVMKVAGTTSRSVQVDFYGIRYDFTNPR